jgi:hypothetical protein
MKSRLVIILCGLLLFLTDAHSQFLRGYGFKLGGVSANQTWDYNIRVNFPTETRWGYDVGVYIEVLDIPYISILGELHYVQKGFSSTLPVSTPAYPEGTGENITLKPRADYLSIPVLAKIRFETTIITPYLFVGPRFDFLIARKAEGTERVFDKLKRTGTGATVGVGFEIPLAFVPSLLAEFRYSPSFDNAFSNEHLTVRNRSVEIVLGVRL